MPYIEPDARKRVLSPSGPRNAGELNYFITHAIRQFLGSNYNYASFNEVVGVLECAKLELYRRMVSEYEDRKKKENGDVYDEYTPEAGW